MPRRNGHSQKREILLPPALVRGVAEQREAGGSPNILLRQTPPGISPASPGLCQPSPVLSIRKHFVQRLLNLLKAGAKGCPGGTHTLRKGKSLSPPAFTRGVAEQREAGGSLYRNALQQTPPGISPASPGLCQPSSVLSIRKHFVQRLLNLLKAGDKRVPRRNGDS